MSARGSCARWLRRRPGSTVLARRGGRVRELAVGTVRITGGAICSTRSWRTARWSSRRSRSMAVAAGAGSSARSSASISAMRPGTMRAASARMASKALATVAGRPLQGLLRDVGPAPALGQTVREPPGVGGRVGGQPLRCVHGAAQVLQLADRLVGLRAKLRLPFTAEPRTFGVHLVEVLLPAFVLEAHGLRPLRRSRDLRAPLPRSSRSRPAPHRSAAVQTTRTYGRYARRNVSAALHARSMRSRSRWTVCEVVEARGGIHELVIVDGSQARRQRVRQPCEMEFLRELGAQKEQHELDERRVAVHADAAEEHLVDTLGRALRSRTRPRCRGPCAGGSPSVAGRTRRARSTRRRTAGPSRRTTTSRRCGPSGHAGPHRAPVWCRRCRRTPSTRSRSRSPGRGGTTGCRASCGPCRRTGPPLRRQAAVEQEREEQLQRLGLAGAVRSTQRKSRPPSGRRTRGPCSPTG